MRQACYAARASGALLMLAGVVSAADLAGIRERGSLRVGVSMFTPWTLENRDGELAGFEIEVARRVARALGVEPEFKVYVWEEIIEGLERDEIDLIAAGMAITPFRALRVDFSDPYSEEGFTVVVNTGLVDEAVEDVRALDLDGYVIAIVDETLSGQAAPLFFDRAEVDVFPEARDAEAAVLAGRAHAYLTSVPEATLLVARFSDQLRVPLAAPLAGAPAGFAVQLGNATLLGFLNEWIRSSEQRQWLDTIYDEWFGSSN